MNLDAIELHDAIFKGMEIDPLAGTISITLDYYPDSTNSRERSPATILFTKVSQHSQICDLNELQSNARAGNVVSWVPAEAQGSTYIYLVRGFISITAGHCSFIAQKAAQA